MEKTIEEIKNEIANMIAVRYVDELHQKIARRSALEAATRMFFYDQADKYRVDIAAKKEAKKEAKERTIEKACEWLNQNTDWGEKDTYEGEIEEVFRRAMDEDESVSNTVSDTIFISEIKYMKTIEDRFGSPFVYARALTKGFDDRTASILMDAIVANWDEIRNNYAPEEIK